MPILIPPGFAEVTVHFTPSGSGRACNSVFGLGLDDTWDELTFGSFSSNLSTSYKQVLHTGGHYDGLTALVGQDGGDPVVFETTEGAGNGTRTGDLAPPQVQALVKKSSATFGRKGRGRTFVPDMLESQINDDGSLTSGGLTVVGTFATQVLEAFNDVILPSTGMYILHSSSTPPSLVTSYSAENKVATLRPRYVR